MTTQSNINGVTIKDITRMMISTEKLINFYNKKYNFEIENASAKEQREYKSALERWDFMKSKRDQLKAA